MSSNFLGGTNPDLKLFLLTINGRSVEYTAEKTDNSHLELTVTVGADQGSEELTMGAQLDPSKYNGDSSSGTAIDLAKIELLVQTNPKIEGDKIDNYG